jgi:predicted  nucleic acid-binding Zn-ribbon protein
MARTKQTARRSTKASTNVALLEETEQLRAKVIDLELEIEEMKKRCNCGVLSDSKAKRLKKIKDVIHELEQIKEELV